MKNFIKKLFYSVILRHLSCSLCFDRDIKKIITTENSKTIGGAERDDLFADIEQILIDALVRKTIRIRSIQYGENPPRGYAPVYTWDLSVNNSMTIVPLSRFWMIKAMICAILSDQLDKPLIAQVVEQSLKGKPLKFRLLVLDSRSPKQNRYPRGCTPYRGILPCGPSKISIKKHATLHTAG